MRRIRACLIEEDEWRSRGIDAVLTAGGIEVLRFETFDRFVLDGSACDLVIVSEVFCRTREQEVMAGIAETAPSARILVFGDFDSPEDAVRLFAAGVHGCFDLSFSPPRLLEAVELVTEGKVWGNRESLAAAITWKSAPREPARHRVARDEFRLLRLLEAGLTNKEIAQRLGFAESTVKARFNRLYRRFGVNSRVQLLTAAMRKGILRSRAER